MDNKLIIEYTLRALKIPYEKEYLGIPGRKFRFDFCIPEKNIAIEYEGIYCGKSRHTTTTGYTTDAKKYNLAVLNGWKVLRYTASNINEFESDIKQLYAKAR